MLAPGGQYTKLQSTDQPRQSNPPSHARNLFNSNELRLNATSFLLAYVLLNILHNAHVHGSVAAILIYPISTICYALTEAIALFNDYIPHHPRLSKLVL